MSIFSKYRHHRKDTCTEITVQQPPLPYDKTISTPPYSLSLPLHKIILFYCELSSVNCELVKKHIPNIVTLKNLASGCIGIMLAGQGELGWGAAMIFMGAAFDFADGFVARALGVSSELGKQLDSLSDGVTFGVLPSYLLVSFWEMEQLCMPWYVLAPLFVFALAAAYRLGKFNIDTRQTTSFLGVPTPAAGIFVAAYILAYELSPLAEWEGIRDVLYSIPAAYIIVVTFALLMISEIPMFAMKVKGISWRGNEFRYILLIVAVVLIILLKFAGVALTIIAYILLSIIENLVRKNEVRS